MKNLKKPTIFLVDDRPDNIELLSEILENAGFHIFVAHSGKEALQNIQQTLPDLILLDVVMPDMNGFEVCRRLKAEERTKDIPVIFVTALSEASNRQTGFDVGGVDYIAVPSQSKKILACVKANLDLQ